MKAVVLHEINKFLNLETSVDKTSPESQAAAVLRKSIDDHNLFLGWHSDEYQESRKIDKARAFIEGIFPEKSKYFPQSSLAANVPYEVIGYERSNRTVSYNSVVNGRDN